MLPPQSPDPRGELKRLIADAERHLELEGAFGVSRIPFDPENVARLARAKPFGSVQPPTASATSAQEKQAALDQLRQKAEACRRCELGERRKNLVFGDGHPDADLMFVGEAPGQREDEQGIPFVGAAGQLLTKIIEAIGLDRKRVYIGNVLKCRPPNNRAPLPDEAAACFPYLCAQIEIIQPKIIVAMGNPAMRTILQTRQGITRMRGKFVEWNGIEVMPTFHTAYLLRNPAAKRDVWQDMQKVHARMKELGLPIGELKRGRR